MVRLAGLKLAMPTMFGYPLPSCSNNDLGAAENTPYLSFTVVERHSAGCQSQEATKDNMMIDSENLFA
jgi:hypothetical protein